MTTTTTYTYLGSGAYGAVYKVNDGLALKQGQLGDYEAEALKHLGRGLTPEYVNLNEFGLTMTYHQGLTLIHLKGEALRRAAYRAAYKLGQINALGWHHGDANSSNCLEDGLWLDLGRAHQSQDLADETDIKYFIASLCPVTLEDWTEDLMDLYYDGKFSMNV